MSRIFAIGGMLSCALFAATPQYSRSAPAITSVAGALNQGATITITGSGFGSRTATPYFYSDFDSDALGETALQAGLADLGTDGQGLPYVNDVEKLGAGRSLRMDYALSKNSMFPRVGIGGLNATEVYVSAWLYWKQTSVGQSGELPIFKLVRGGANPPYSGDPRFYETIRPNGSGNVVAVDRGSVASNGSVTYADDINAGQNAGAWHHIEYYFKLSTPGSADGVYQTWVDGVQNVNVTNTMSRVSGNSATINYVMSPFDGMDSYGLTNAYSVWVDDLYVDTTRARVELGDASTLAACKVRYIQPTSAWSDGSISAEIEPNTLGAGTTAYMYVFDSSGNVNANGYPVTISGAVPDAPKIQSVQ